MKRVGILAGREVTFPESIINAINERGNGQVTAEMITRRRHQASTSQKSMTSSSTGSRTRCHITVRCSSEWRLRARISSTTRSGGRRTTSFLTIRLAAKLGVAIPKTVLLPQHAYIKDITSE